MALTEQTASLKARNLITERNEGAVGISLPKIIAIIPTALEVWFRQVMKNPRKKQELEKSANVQVTNGTADLAEYFGATENFDKYSFGRCGAQDASGEKIFTVVNSLSMLKSGRSLSQVFGAVFFDGDTLRTRNTDGSLATFNGTVRVSGTVRPAKVDQIPAALEGDFILTLAQLAQSEFGKKK